eukprot:SAG11_NODE_1419_length_4957_cov_3.968711_3_plen_69_part_00
MWQGHLLFVDGEAALAAAETSAAALSVPTSSTFAIASDVDPTVPGARVTLEGGIGCRASQWSLGVPLF